MEHSRRDFLGCMASTGVFAALPALGSAARAVYPGWKPGELDIHCIQTGCGEQTFFIFPDGTTMLLDCGDMYRPQYLMNVPRQPGPERLGGEWVSRYVQRLIPQRTIDYFVLTHWHADHCGGPSLRSECAADGRRVCGITRFAEDFAIRHYFDHQYPRSGVYASSQDSDALEMRRAWIPLMHDRCGMQPHAFEVGARNQIKMLGSDAAKYEKAFSIRNLHANCVYWDGKGGTVDYAPEYMRQRPEMNGTIAENALSLGFRLDYGKFSAYFGGDIDYPDYEDRLASVIGKVNVCKMNHHGCPTSMGRELCRQLAPQLYLACIWSPNQITDINLVNMTSRELYPGPRYLCPGYLPKVKKREYAGRDFMNDYLPVQGHTVVKVAPGGASWEFFVLTVEDESMTVLHHQEMGI